MLFTDSSLGRNFAKDPAVIRFKDTYYLYYSTMSEKGDEEPRLGIGIATSKDLKQWTKVTDLQPVGEEERDGICAPGAMVYDGKVHLFYQTYGNFEKDSICHAYSEDGLNFVRNVTNPIIRAEGAWNNGRAIDADVCIFQGELYLYFATRDPEGKIQMQVVSKCPLDGCFHKEKWTQMCEESILFPELDWEQDCIEAAATIVHNNKIFMFYGGAYNNQPQQIGVAVSYDGITFQRVFDKPILANGEPGSWNACESGHPYIFEDEDGRIYLFYQGNDDFGESWYLSKKEIVFKNDMPEII